MFLHQYVIYTHASFIDALTQVTAIFMANGQKGKALTRTRQQIQVLPNDPSLYNLLGNIALAQDKDTEAEEAFKKAIELRDDLLISYLNLGRGSSTVNRGMVRLQ